MEVLHMKNKIEILNGQISIPSILWGTTSKRILIEIHGNMANKEDPVNDLIARKAVAAGYQVISFDLPEHGERRYRNYACSPQNCISDLKAVYNYAKTIGQEISIFACSMGAYFALMAYHYFDIKQSFFLSPVVDMHKIIMGMMDGFDISEERLEQEKTITLPIGQILDWDSYHFVKTNPITFEWNSPIHILYGKQDNMCAYDDIVDFSNKYNALVTVDQEGEHYYHTPAHLDTIDQWFKRVFKIDS